MSDDKPPEITPEMAKQLAEEGARLSDAFFKRTESMAARPGDCCRDKDAQIAALREALREAILGSGELVALTALMCETIMPDHPRAWDAIKRLIENRERWRKLAGDA